MKGLICLSRDLPDNGTLIYQIKKYRNLSLFPIYKFLKMGYNVRKVSMEVDDERTEIKNIF